MICIGTVKKFCKNYTEIENYAEAIADTTQVWECHHRLELIETGAVVDSSKQDLIDWGIYYDRPADELIFLTAKNHVALHNKRFKGKKFSDEHREKISKSQKGNTYCKGNKHSEETKKRISNSLKGNTNGKGYKHSEEAKQKMSESRSKMGWKIDPTTGKRVYYVKENRI